MSELRDEQAQIEIGYDFDVLWYNHGQTDLQYRAALRRIGDCSGTTENCHRHEFNRTLLKQETTLSGRRRANAHGVVVAIPPARLEPRWTGRAEGIDADCGTGARLPEFLRM
ncbi:hypothetical protein [Bradyrhizobium sp. DASA03007]|uniref:hypothetical protein n=1 Tax=unclassified Bradyrhizobium TaxID=2631580 RepID=UPI003F6F2283